MRGALLLLPLHIALASAFVCPAPLAPAAGIVRPRAFALLARAAADETGGLPVTASLPSRRAVIGATLSAALAAGPSAHAAPAGDAVPAASEKDVGLNDEELRKKLEYDVTTNQFMVTGALTRSLYDESCTFTDEIDTYTLDKWIQGTGLLFKNDYSKMELASPITITKDEASFAFKEQLMFNIPILKPKVPLTGKLVLKRGGNGLFTSYKESWDQGVAQVLLSAKLF